MVDNNEEICWSYAELRNEINKILPFVDKDNIEVICRWTTSDYTHTLDHYYNKLNFILVCAFLSIKYPQIITYLEDFLKTCSIKSLNALYVNGLEYFLVESIFLVSFKVFKLFIKYGMRSHNIYFRGDTSLHILYNVECNFKYFLSQNKEYIDLCFLKEDLPGHITKIIKLLVNDVNKISFLGCDLNHCNSDGHNVLDLFKHITLNELNKHIIRTLLDHGATLNLIGDTALVDFVDAYKFRNIKPAKK